MSMIINNNLNSIYYKRKLLINKKVYVFISVKTSFRYILNNSFMKKM